MMLLVNEVFKVYNYVLIHNCIQQYVLNYFSMIYGYYDYYYMTVYLWHMYVYLSIVKKLYVIILMEQLL